METKNRNYLLWFSLLGNVLLLSVGIYIGCFKTSYITRQLQKMGLQEKDETLIADYWCIRGWTNTLEKLDLNVDVVFFGNSITYGCNFDKQFPHLSICNLGYPGDNLDGMLRRIDQIKVVHPKNVFVMAGINGLSNQSQQEFMTKYSILVDSINKVVPTSRVFLQSILPVNPTMDAGKTYKGKTDKIVAGNDAIRRIAKERECVYIDLYNLYAKDNIMPSELTRDGVHLYPKSYDRWAEVIRKYLE